MNIVDEIQLDLFENTEQKTKALQTNPENGVDDKKKGKKHGLDRLNNKAFQHYDQVEENFPNYVM